MHQLPADAAARRGLVHRTTPRTGSWWSACTPRSSPSSTWSSNVRAEAASLGVHYPVAIDDNYATWNAYGNEYWPADYLIDATGDVRHVHFGEGDYADTETLIRQLLTDAHPRADAAARDRRARQDPDRAR